MRFLTALLLLALLSLARPASAQEPVGTWSSLSETVNRWSAEDPDLVSRFFGPGTRYRMLGTSRWLGNAVMLTSLEGFATRARNMFPGTVVAYNPEAEPVTPWWERTHPRKAMGRFVEIAHSHGLFAVLAPARSLAGPDPKCSQFLDCRYVSIRADAFQLLAQRLECDLPAFTDFVSRAKALARSPLIVQITVGWNVPCVTPEVVRDAWRAALPWADGFALWGHADPVQNAKALEVMRLIAMEMV
jgi:hypothetical protein